MRVHPSYLQGQHLPAAARGKDVWKRRYREINDWERYLVDNGFVVVTDRAKMAELAEVRRKFSGATGGVGSNPVRHGGTTTALAYSDSALEKMRRFLELGGQTREGELRVAELSGEVAGLG